MCPDSDSFVSILARYLEDVDVYAAHLFVTGCPPHPHTEIVNSFRDKAEKLNKMADVGEARIAEQRLRASTLAFMAGELEAMATVANRESGWVMLGRLY